HPREAHPRQTHPRKTHPRTTHPRTTHPRTTQRAEHRAAPGHPLEEPRLQLRSPLHQGTRLLQRVSEAAEPIDESLPERRAPRPDAALGHPSDLLVPTAPPLRHHTDEVVVDELELPLERPPLVEAQGPRWREHVHALPPP